MPLELSNDQKSALAKLTDWATSENNPNKSNFITLGGYAGTGKTTLISLFRQNYEKHKKEVAIAFCAFTGKATQVLKRRLVEHHAVFNTDFIGTIHSLIYKAVTDVSGAILGWELRQPNDVEFDLIVVDEASMLDERIWADLRSFRIPIIAVGDHGQLPPISGTFNLMQKPQIKLEQIHRQARQNPIIKLSIMARENGEIPAGRYGPNVEKVAAADSGTMIEDLLAGYNPDTLMLCGYNSTRMKINASVRGLLGFESPDPCVDDRVICLRNNREKNIFNGMLGTILDIKESGADKYKVRILLDGGLDPEKDEIYEGKISREQFNVSKTLNNINGAVRTKDLDLFDFGYALTVHKAQGSQARRVIVFEERFKNQDDEMWRRWLYTAVTRAEEELTLVG